jgi:hypothetical protein
MLVAIVVMLIIFQKLALQGIFVLILERAQQSVKLHVIILAVMLEELTRQRLALKVVIVA